jgi:hypothetical protein
MTEYPLLVPPITIDYARTKLRPCQDSREMLLLCFVSCAVSSALLYELCGRAVGRLAGPGRAALTFEWGVHRPALAAEVKRGARWHAMSGYECVQRAYALSWLGTKRVGSCYPVNAH